MKDKLQEYALVAEIIGALAVVISLLYVGASVNQNTAATMVSNHQALVQMDSDNNSWLKDAEFAALVQIGNSGTGELSAAQRAQYMTWNANFFNDWEFSFITHNNGMLADNIWNGWDGFHRNRLRRSGVQEFWASGRMNFSPEFTEYVDSVLAERN